jgi:hypothetical protein
VTEQVGLDIPLRYIFKPSYSRHALYAGVGGKPLDRQVMLRHKEDKLISALKKVVTGNEPSYIFDFENERHYQIWFYNPFDFNYIFIGQENFVINISDNDDEMLISDLQKKFERQSRLFPNEDIDFNEYLRAIEFEFFADCWDKLQKDLSRTFRCFLIEYGIIRGLDVNNRSRVDGEKIDRILANEN